jgi:hypothetical protein
MDDVRPAAVRIVPVDSVKNISAEERSAPRKQGGR